MADKQVIKKISDEEASKLMVLGQSYASLAEDTKGTVEFSKWDQLHHEKCVELVLQGHPAAADVLRQW